LCFLIQESIATQGVKKVFKHQFRFSTRPTRFGTGLKYAMAVLVRSGAEPDVRVGRDLYRFQKTPAEFRGRRFDALRMRCERFRFARARYAELPYTTEYGRNWKIWQAFRELEANTRDENGRTYAADAPAEGIEGRTLIAVRHPEMVEAFEKIGTIFLSGAEQDEGVQVLPGESDYLYWRGLRVLDLRKPSLRTWNVRSYMELTEDRTLKYEFFARSAVAEHVLRCDDERLIHDVVTANDDSWEHGLEFAGEPSRAFRRVMERKPRGISSDVWGWWQSSHAPRSPVRPPRHLAEAHPFPWRYDNGRVLDSEGEEVFVEPSGYRGSWGATADAIIRRVTVWPSPQDEAADHALGDPPCALPAPAAAPRPDEDELPF
jgi:hypothetical protein